MLVRTRPPLTCAVTYPAVQLDEVDMGMSYAELSLYGRLRKVARAGPVAMYNACAAMWKGKLGPAAVATKVGNLAPNCSVI